MANDEVDELLDDDEGDEEESRPRGKQYITRGGAERLHKELLKLMKEDRPRVTAEVAYAASLGDRSENAEYLYGKKKLREIDRRIRFLQKRLDACTVVDPKEQKDRSRVFFGATVTLEDEEGQTSRYQLVGPDEIDTRGGRISMDSPIGKALMGKRAGDAIEVQRPRGEIELTILNIEYV